MKKILLTVLLVLSLALPALAGWDGTGPMKVEDGVVSPKKDSWSVSAGASIVSDADGITLDKATHNGKIILMTGPGEVGMWDCSTANVGSFSTIFVRDASEQVEVVMNGDTTNDLFRLSDGTETDANDEADLPTTGNQKFTFMCVENNKWYVWAEDAAVTDGGAAD